MCRPSKYETSWGKPEKLEQVTAWLAEGLTQEQVIEKMNVSRSIFFDWKNKFSDFLDAIKKGEELGKLHRNKTLKLSMWQCAVGGQTVWELHETLDKDGNVTSSRRVTKVLPPNPTMQIFLSTNYMPDEFQNRRSMESNVKVEETQRIDFKDMAREKILELAKEAYDE